jgi:hypothetical protein
MINLVNWKDHLLYSIHQGEPLIIQMQPSPNVRQISASAFLYLSATGVA